MESGLILGVSNFSIDPVYGNAGCQHDLDSATSQCSSGKFRSHGKMTAPFIDHVSILVRLLRENETVAPTRSLRVAPLVRDASVFVFIQHRASFDG